jgi:hypothetical protein
MGQWDSQRKWIANHETMFNRRLIAASGLSG